jgi:hypothetical protein
MPRARIQKDLASSLTFHASFDHGADADVARGDGRIYSASRQEGREAGVLTPGLGDPPLGIVEGQGKFGAALVFTQENGHVALYKAEHNVTYSPESFRGTASFWMRLDPADIPGQYCDPVQVTDKDYSDACIWVDFTKNDTPSDFRLGIFGNQSVWDVSNRRGEGEQFFWRVVKVAEPPFAKDTWTHVAVTWDGINSTGGGRGRLYFNAEYRGATGAIREPFTWDVANARIRLGTGHFVGMFDDIAFFDRPLTSEEISVLFGLDGGVVDLTR